MSNLPSVAVATITADRRLAEHSQAIPHRLNYENMWYYVNHEGQELKAVDRDVLPAWQNMLDGSRKLYEDRFVYDMWVTKSDWRPKPQYDQDQARLWAICMARNMCVDFAQHKNADWLLFLDSDVQPPVDAIQKLLEVAMSNGEVRAYVVGGLVPGRGAHGGSWYISWPEIDDHRNILTDTWMVDAEPGQPRQLVKVVKVQHATMGFVMIHRDVYNWLRFGPVVSNHWYTDPDGVHPSALSEDPAFGIMLRYILKKVPEWGPKAEWVVRTDLVAKHLGKLDAAEVAQF